MKNVTRRSFGAGAITYLAGVSPDSHATQRGGRERWTTLPEPAPMPPAVATGHAPVNGIEMFYAVFGEGAPVLLLHAGLANSDYWGGVVPILVRQGLKVVVADSRGHGRSTGSPEPYTYELMASDVLALLDYLTLERVDLIGWSDGAVTGLDIAMEHPERLRRLYAYGVNSDPSGVKEEAIYTATFKLYVERARRDYEKLSATPAEYGKFLAQIQAMWARQPNFPAARLRQIRVPTAIAVGAYDEGIKPEHTRYLVQTIPGATLITLPNVSHFGMLQDPRQFARSVLKFLRAS